MSIPKTTDVIHLWLSRAAFSDKRPGPLKQTNQPESHLLVGKKRNNVNQEILPLASPRAKTLILHPRNGHRAQRDTPGIEIRPFEVPLEKLSSCHQPPITVVVDVILDKLGALPEATVSPYDPIVFQPRKRR